MGRRGALVLSIVLLSASVAPAAHATHDDPPTIHNVEQRVTDHGFRHGASQDRPDIGANHIIWRDFRGDSTSFTPDSLGRIWSKDLTTRDESPVSATLATDDPNPRISGTWVVWTDHTPESGVGAGDSNDDIYACQLPCTGSPVQVTSDLAHQMNPAIDGTTVVWEDYRNVGTGGGVDLFKKDLANLAAAETPVTEAAGNQTAPSVSVSVSSKGKTVTTVTRVAWRDSRDVALPLFNDSDVWVQTETQVAKGSNVPTTTTTEAKADEATGNSRSLSVFQVAVSGTHLLWNEPDPSCAGTGASDCENPKVLKACVLGSTFPCTEVVVDTVPSAPDTFGYVTDLDLSDPRGVWTKISQTATGQEAHAYTRDPVTSGTIVQLDDVEGRGSVGGARVSGQQFTWGQDEDIFWRTLTTQPRRANSISLGRFGGHTGPAADGDLVAYRRYPIEAPGTDDIASVETGHSSIWATDLSEPGRHFSVSNALGTGLSRPAIVGERIVWQECHGQIRHPAQDQGFGGVGGCGNVYERDLADVDQFGGSDLSHLGPPDADGDSTAWRCGDAAICVHDGTSVEFFDVSGELLTGGSVEAFSIVSDLVRISGDVVVWHEFWFDPTVNCESAPCSDQQLHVLDTTTSGDVVIGDESSVGATPDFDISGSTVVMAGGGGNDTLYTADASCATGAATCPTAFVTNAGHTLSSPSIDGDRVAWVDADNGGPCCGGQDIYTAEIGVAGGPYLVTNESTAFVETPYVDGDRIYWVDSREGEADIYMESATGVALPPPDMANPSPPSAFVAAAFGGGVELSWTNPADDDFLRVRILRRSGSTAPTGIDDELASVVYEGSDTAFTDTDLSIGQTYRYKIFAFDYQPNFSVSPPTAVAST